MINNNSLAATSFSTNTPLPAPAIPDWFTVSGTSQWTLEGMLFSYKFGRVFSLSSPRFRSTKWARALLTCSEGESIALLHRTAIGRGRGKVLGEGSILKFSDFVDALGRVKEADFDLDFKLDFPVNCFRKAASLHIQMPVSLPT
jgi:hypothetical protein